MMKNFTSHSFKGIICNVLTSAIIILLTLSSLKSYAQTTKVYASAATALNSHVDNAANAASSSDANFATVRSYGGLAVGLGQYAGALELNFGSTLPANTVSYVRLDSNSDLFKALLGGSLGNVLAPLLGTVALGNHYISVDVLNGTTPVLSGNSITPLTTATARLVTDAEGRFLLALKPAAAYDRIRITDITTALLLGVTNETRVYYAFYNSGVDPCAQAFTTSFDGSGLTLDALNLGAAGVQNPKNAIDNDLTNYSSLGGGVLAIGSEATQNFFFASPSTTGDDFNLRFSYDPAVLNVNLLNGIIVRAYNGDTQVYNQTLNNQLLGLDLLGLLNNGQVISVPFTPNAQYDRVTITLRSLVNANVTQSVRIYGVTRSAGRPTFTAPTGNAFGACFGAPAVLSATTLSTNQLIWYEAAEGGTPLATVAYNATYTTAPLTANKTYYVAARTIGCTAESARVPAVVTVNPAITFNATTLPNATANGVYSQQLSAATGGTPGFTYALAPSNTLPAGLTLSSSGLISGTPTIPNTYTFSVVATDTKGCTATITQTLLVTGPLTLTPATLPNGITGVPYPSQIIPAATGGTGPYTYTATNLPPGLTFNVNNPREIIGTPTLPGTYTIPVTVTDANGYTTTLNYTIRVTNPFSLPAATLAIGTRSEAYGPQTIPSAAGGTTPYTYTATGLPAGLTFNPATRVISGVPTVTGTFAVTVTAKDADLQTAAQVYSLRVVEPLTLASAALPDGTANVAYTTQTLPSATGGVNPYTYTTLGTLPAGITFDAATRQVSGTPTVAGNYTIPVRVTDSLGRTATANYTLRVAGALNLPTASLPNGTVGTTYPTQTLPAVIGGTPTYEYTALPNTLPPGLSFDGTTRQISGTPTAGGTYSFPITVKDANNNIATTTYTITVNVPAPVVASTTVCSNAGATLTISNFRAGQTYNLYGPTGSTPIATSSTNTITTPAITSQTTFYVEAVSGTGVSTRTSVVVSVNPPATLATITTPNQVINTNQSTTLTATADAGNTISWYDVPTGGIALATNTSSYSTGALTATKTYYVETTTATGCASASRVPVTVTVIPGGSAAFCSSATTQNSGITGVCIACNIADPGNSTDANPNNATRISLAVGVGATGFQTLIFPKLGNAADSIRLDLGLPTGLADVGVLNNITVTVLNGAQVVRTVTINNNLLTLSLLGGSRFAATVAAGGVYDRVRVSFGATVAALSSLDVYGAIQVYPNPTITSNADPICAGATKQITATVNGGTSVVWYDSATGTTQVGTGENFTTPALNATTTFYAQVSRDGCVNATRFPVTVTVNPAIVFAGTTLRNSTIASPYNTQLPVATGGTPGFTYALASGSNLPAGLTLSTAGLISGTPTAAAASPTFDVVATDSRGCTATATFTLATNPALALTAVPLPDGIVGTGYPVTTIPSATGGSGPYTYTATNLPPGLTFNPVTREVTGIPTTKGSYIVPVNVTDADGNSIQTNFTINVVDPLSLPAATLANGTTGVAYPPQTIPSAVGGTTPYTYTASGLPAGLTFNPATREISGVPTQAGTFPVVVTVTDNGGRTATNTYPVTIVDPLVLPSATLADGNENVNYPTQTIPSATGGVGPYTYVASGLPNGLSFNPATREITGIPTQAGNYVVSVTVTDAGGRTAQNTYSLRVIGALTLPSATLPNGTVNVLYPTQTLPAVSGGTAPYTYLATNLPPGLNFNTQTREITGTPTSGGTYIISLTATDAAGNKATTNYSLTVTVDAPVVAGVTVCAGSPATIAVASPQSNITYNLYGPTGNAPIATNTTGVFTTPAVTAQTTFYVEAASGTAVSSRTPVTVSVNPSAPLATITTTNQTINAGQNTTLLATAEAGNTIAWFDAATGGNQVGSGSSFITPTLTATTTYYVETRNASGCASASRVPVTVNVIPGGTGVACNAATGQVSGTTGICLLCGITDAGNSTDANTANYTRISVAVGVGATGFQQLIFPNKAAATDSVRLELALPGGLLDLQLLNSITVTLSNGANSFKTTTLNSGLLNLRLLSGNRFSATIVGGQEFDRVEVRLGGLVTALTSLDVYGATIVYPSPTITAGSQTICSGSTATLTATANGGTTLAWYDVAQGGTQLATGETYTTAALTTTTTFYIEVIKNGCANTTRIPVTVTVTPALPAPAAAAAAGICAGNTATLVVNNPTAGVTYNWYAAATGGTPLYTGATVTTQPLAASTTFYVEAAQGNCVSATRTPVAVTVNPRPTLPVVTASATTVAPGQSVILNATSSEANITFNWYNAQTDGTLLYSGPTYVSQPLTTNTSFYVEAVSANGCSSATRVAVNITVTGGGPNPVPCEAATAQTNGTVGLVVLGGVFNPALAIDNDTQTGSSLVIPVGLLGSSVYQRAAFGSVSNPGDTVRVLLTTPGKLLSLDLLGSTQITTYLGTSSNGDARFLNNNTLNVQLLSNNSQALITYVPASTFDAVEIRLNSGVASALTSVNFNYAQRILAAPTVASPNVTACANQTTQLVVSNPSTNLTYRWYDATGAYIPNSDGIIFTTPVLTADTRFYVAAVSASGCVSYKTLVNVTVTPAPDAPVLLAPTVNTCVNTTVILRVQNPVAGLTYRWYNAAGVYQAGLDGDSFTVTNVTGTTTYSVEAVNSCGTASATKSTATINVGTIDPPVVTPPSATVISGSVATFNATSSTVGAVINWYDDATSTTALTSTNGNFTTPPLTASKTYYVEASVSGGCTSVRVPVQVTVVSAPGPQDDPCGSATTQTFGTTGLALGQTVINPTFAVDGNASTGSTLVIPVGLLNSSVFQTLGFPATSNVGDTLRVKLTTPGQLLSVALLSNLTITTYQGGTSNGDVTSVSNPLISLNLLSGTNSAILTYVPTSRFDAVEVRLTSGVLGVLTQVNLDYAQRTILKPTVTVSSVTTCQGTGAVLSVQNPQQGVTYRWYAGNTFTGVTAPTFTTDAALAPNTYDYFVTANANGCESDKVQVTVTVLVPPTPPVPSPGNPATTCFGSPATLSVVAVAGNSYNWYDAAVNGNLLAANTSTFTTPANLPAGSTYTYYVGNVNASTCGSLTRTPISVTVNQNAVPGDITVTGNTGVCVGGVATLTATANPQILAPVYTWYSDAALTTVVSTQRIFTTPAILAPTTYYVTVSGTNRCANPAGSAQIVTITINPPAGAADILVAGNTSLCLGSGTTLTASSTTVTDAVFTWYSDRNLTTVVSNTAQFVVPPVSTAGSVSYFVTVRGSNKCENTVNTAREVIITVNGTTDQNEISITGNLTICEGSGTQLSASAVNITNPVFTWYSNSALTTVVNTGSTFNITSLTATTTYYVVVSGSNRCANTASPKEVTVTVNPYGKSDDFTVANQTVCEGSGATLVAAVVTKPNMVLNPVFTWYNDPSLTSVAFVGPIFNLTNVTASRTYYVTIKGSNRCESKPGDNRAVTVTVNPLTTPGDIVVTAPAAICAGSAVTLVADAPTITNPVYRWYSDANLTNIAFVGKTFATQPLFVTTTYYVSVSGDNRCANAPGNGKSVTITVNGLPPAPVIATTGTSICTGDATTLSIVNPQAGVDYQWYSAALNGTLLRVGTTFSPGPLNATTDFYVRAVNASGCGNAAGLVKVTVTVAPRPTTPTVAAASVSVCTGSVATLTVTNPQANVTYNWYTSATGLTVVNTGATFITPAINANVTYFVEALSGACTSTARTAVNVIALPVPVAPVSVTAATDPLCPTNTGTVLTVNSPVAGLVYRWYNVATNGTFLAEGITFTTPSLTATTTYYVESIAVGGCASPTRTAITVTVAPKLATPVVVTGSRTATSITFTWAAVPNATGYEISTDKGATWQAATGTSYLAAGLTPGQTVSILVRAKGQLDCQTSDNGSVTDNSDNPLGNQVYIPNVFTPNNDGKNDIFLIYGNTIASARMSVYTQWGQLIFQSDNVATGWDGTFKGVNQPIGVYVYMVEIKFNDGTDSMRKGTITLVR